MKIIDNGHTIQVNYAPGSFIDVGGHRYELVQFHKPSEKSIDGKRYDMVAHLVHKDADGHLAVVFAGSLTPPPCSEGVNGFVLKNPTSLSAGEISRFAKEYPMNARPAQPLNDRVVHASR